MFPLYDDNPSSGTALITVAIIALNVAVWLLVQGAGSDTALIHSLCAYGLIPGELLGRVAPGTRIRLGGLVAPGSLVRGENLAVKFDVTDGKGVINVAYQGLLPDLFREGQGVVTEGVLQPGGSFKADTVLAKHDENYIPKEVADALKKQGHWKDDYAKKGGTTQGRTQ